MEWFLGCLLFGGAFLERLFEVSNNAKEDLAIRIDDAILTALSDLNIRQSGAIVELVQRFAHSIVDHAELVPPTWQQCVERMCRG